MERSGNDPCSIVSALRQGMLFTIGSLLILQEKVYEFAQEALERGHEAQEEGRKLVQEMRAQREQDPPSRTDPLDIRINATLERLDIPSADEITELDQQIIELSQRVDELKAAG